MGNRQNHGIMLKLHLFPRDSEQGTDLIDLRRLLERVIFLHGPFWRPRRLLWPVLALFWTSWEDERWQLASTRPVGLAAGKKIEFWTILFPGMGASTHWTKESHPRIACIATYFFEVLATYLNFRQIWILVHRREGAPLARTVCLHETSFRSFLIQAFSTVDIFKIEHLHSGPFWHFSISKIELGQFLIHELPFESKWHFIWILFMNLKITDSFFSWVDSIWVFNYSFESIQNRKIYPPL